LAEPLEDVPNGSNVLVDANIFVYGLTASSNQCRRFLERCSTEEITGLALFESVNNATHQFMKGEAIAKHFCVTQAMQFLSQHPQVVMQLTEYWVNTERLLNLNLLFVPLEESILRGAQPERINSGFLTNDSMIVAAMREYGVSRLATNDRRFDGVAGITVFSPTDI
jgi:predicted nucleic acid-binding protein